MSLRFPNTHTNAEFGGRQEAPVNTMRKLYCLFMFMLLASLAAQAATNYGIKVAGVSVTSSNAGNVTGNNISGTVTYDNSTKTLTMTNVTINLDSGTDRALLNTGCSGLTVKFVGTCKLYTRNKAAVRTECNTTLSAPSSSTSVSISGAIEGAIFMAGSSHTLYFQGPGNFDIRTVYCPAIEGAEESGSGIQLQTPYYVTFSNVTALLSSSENDIRRIVNVTFNSNSHVILKATNNSSYSTVSQVGCVFNGNETILEPMGAYAASDGTIKDANGNNIHDQDVYISDNYAFLINSTNFPNGNFRNYMLSLYPKGYMTQSEVQNLTTLNVDSKGITNMKGVERLTYLQSLSCSQNSISSLDLSSNTRLTNLSCYGNNMSSLNVNNCTQLTRLDCAPNKLISLNLSNLTKLQKLYCYDNKLSSITFASSTPDLETVQCHSNSFTSFTLTGRPSLKKLDVSNCPNLKSVLCQSNNLTDLDVSENYALVSIQCANNQNLAYIEGLDDCTALETLHCSNCSLTNLNAVSVMPKLEMLYCSNNKLTSLTVQNKSKLTTVYCDHNPNLTTATITSNSLLTTLGINDCPALTTLLCYYNALTTLSVSSNTALQELRCYNNANLASVTGLGSCTAITYLDVDDCAFTGLPVQNMTNITTIYACNNRLTTLSVNNKSQLKTLRLLGNPSLTLLSCYNDALTYLNVSGCTALTNLTCYGNAELQDILGLGECANLVTLTAANCKLNSLTVANLSKLQTLNCIHNQLTSLNVSGCTALTEIDCYMNRISGSGMTTLVNSLPTRSASSPGGLYVIYDSEENNSMTAAQITTARNKYWLPKRYTTSGWMDLAASQRGDVDGDGNVNIADVTALIDMLLSGNTAGNAAADCNQDGGVNIADVTALIDFLLSGHW